MSYVYFAQCGNYVKIGFSYRPEQRVKFMLHSGQLIVPKDVHHGVPVQLIHTIPGCIMRDERDIHALFSRYRLIGEWFRYCPGFIGQLERLQYVTVTQRRINVRRAKADLKKQRVRAS